MVISLCHRSIRIDIVARYVMSVAECICVAFSPIRSAIIREPFLPAFSNPHTFLNFHRRQTASSQIGN